MSAPTAAGGTPTPRLVRLPAVLLLVVAVLFTPEVEPLHRAGLILAAAAAALALATRGAPAASREAVTLSALALVPLLLGTWGTADQGATRDMLVHFAIGVVAFRSGRVLLGPGAGLGGWSLLAGIGTWVAAHGLYQRWEGFQQALAALPQGPEAEVVALRLGTGRIFATLLLPSALAGLLLLTLPVTIALAAHPRGTAVGRAAAALGTVAQTTALLLTYSLGALAALAAGLTWVGIARAARPRRMAMGAAATVGLLLVGVGLLRGEPFLAGSGADPLSERMGNWQVAVEQAADHPLRGVGWGAYGAAYPAYQQPGMNQARHAHNTYLQFVAEGGVATLPFLAAFALWGLGTARRVRPGLELAAAVAVAATLAHAAVDFTFFLAGPSIPFLALAGGLARGATPVPRAGRVAAVALAAGIALFGLPAALARHEAAAARAAQEEGDAGEARRHIERARLLDPWTAAWPDFQARWELDHGRGRTMPLRARGLAEEACRLAPRTPHHRTTLELACLAQGDLGCAYRAAARAADLFPASPEYAARRDRLRGVLEGG